MDLEQRVDALEKEVAELKLVLSTRPREIKTFIPSDSDGNTYDPKAPAITNEEYHRFIGSR